MTELIIMIWFYLSIILMPGIAYGYQEADGSYPAEFNKEAI